MLRSSTSTRKISALQPLITSIQQAVVIDPLKLELLLAALLPGGMFSWKTCPAWAKHSWPVRWPNRCMPASSVFNVRRIYYQAISRAAQFTISGNSALSFVLAPCLLKLCW